MRTESPARAGNNFDALRLLLAVTVIASHAWPLGTGSEAAEPVRVLTHGQMTGGAVAVDLFFVMSGYLIAASAERSSSVWSFLKKRALRIYPAFVVCAIVTALVVVPLSGGVSTGPANFVGQTLRLRVFDVAGAFAGNPYPGAVNGSLWSVAFEFWCYIGVAVLAVAGVLRRRWMVAALFVGAWAASVVWQWKGIVMGGKWLGVVLGSPQLWARLLPLYLVGVVFWVYRERVRFTAWGAVIACVALGVGCVLPLGMATVFPLAAGYLVLGLAFAPWLRLQHAGRFGDFSYGAYLYAFPVEQLLMRWWGHTVSPWMLFAAATPVTLVLAVASWYGVERWFLQRVKARDVSGSSLPVASEPVAAVVTA